MFLFVCVFVCRCQGYVYTYRIHRDDAGSWAAEVRHFTIKISFSSCVSLFSLCCASFHSIPSPEKFAEAAAHICLAYWFRSSFGAGCNSTSCGGTNMCLVFLRSDSTEKWVRFCFSNNTQWNPSPTNPQILKMPQHQHILQRRGGGLHLTAFLMGCVIERRGVANTPGLGMYRDIWRPRLSPTERDALVATF